MIEGKFIGLGIDWLDRLFSNALTKRREDHKEITNLLNQSTDELRKLYVEPDFQPYNPANQEEDEPDDTESVFRRPAYEWLDGFLVEPKRKDGRHVAFVLSDAGMGKTSLLAMLKLSSMSIPSFWPGRTFRLLKLGPTFLEEIEAQKDPLNTILLLDSLDEDPEAFGRIEDRLAEILKATQRFSHVIVTCRTQFFPLQNPFERGGARIKIAGFTCRVVYLSLFSEAQIDAYLKKLYPRNSTRMAQARDLILSMKSLRMRPMLLAHVEDLMEKQNIVKEWTPLATHGALVDAWLDREERKGKNVTAENLRSACHIMAIHLQKSGDRVLETDFLAALVAQRHVPDAISNVQEFGGRTLLNLNSDGGYRFAHYIIQEYFVVDHMIRHPEKMKNYASQIRYSDELVAFLREFTLATKRGWRAELSRANLSRAYLQGANLRGADLSMANISEGNLSEADLSGANLREADLRWTDLTKANLSEAKLTGAYLGKAMLQEANLGGANLRGANFDGADLRGAKCSKVDFDGATLRNADLTGADLTQAQLDSIAKGGY